MDGVKVMPDRYIQVGPCLSYMLEGTSASTGSLFREVLHSGRCLGTILEQACGWVNIHVPEACYHKCSGIS